MKPKEWLCSKKWKLRRIVSKSKEWFQAFFQHKLQLKTYRPGPNLFKPPKLSYDQISLICFMGLTHLIACMQCSYSSIFLKNFIQNLEKIVEYSTETMFPETWLCFLRKFKKTVLWKQVTALSDMFNIFYNIKTNLTIKIQHFSKIVKTGPYM